MPLTRNMCAAVVLMTPPMSILVSLAPCVQAQSLGAVDQHQARNRAVLRREAKWNRFQPCSATLEGKTVDDPTVPQKPGPTPEASSDAHKGELGVDRRNAPSRVPVQSLYVRPANPTASETSPCETLQTRT